MNDKLIISIISILLIFFVATDFASTLTSSIIYFLKSITRATANSI